MSEVVAEQENVRVVVRVRPLSEKEQKLSCSEVIKIDTLNRSISVRKPQTPTDVPKTFTFDYVFDTEATQLDIYSETARPIVDSVIEGYNGTILAYGQTGTGKTYTMSGTTTPETRGIIPNTFAQMFGHIAKANGGKKFLVCVTYIEIYNEEIRDLITNTGNLEVREKSHLGVFVNGLTGYICKNADEIDHIMRLGNQNRVVGATAMNEESSRSHAILTITIESSIKAADGTQRLRQGKLSLVDLAGSERQSKTLATGVRLKESTKINLSLSVLGNVISALVDGKSTHIPYRNSKLTRLLQDSLGGNSKTVMIANIGPADNNYEETISTLRYANRAKNIQNHTKPNEEPQDTLLRAFEKQIDDLRKQLEEDVPSAIVVEEEVVEEEEEEDEPINESFVTKEEINNDKPTDDLGGSFSELSLEKTDDATKEVLSRKIMHFDELNKTITEQTQIQDKLSKLEEKILVGGENLLEKAQIQEKLLEESAKELEERRTNEEKILQTIKNMEAERIDIEERYNSLSEEIAGKSKKLNKITSMLAVAKAELADLQQEQQREMEGTLENMRTVTRELQLSDMVINEHVPVEYYKKLETFAQWNEDIGEWQLKCVAYTGNHMRKHEECLDLVKLVSKSPLEQEFPVYLPYHTSERKHHNAPQRVHSSVPRPTTRRPRKTIIQ